MCCRILIKSINDENKSQRREIIAFSMNFNFNFFNDCYFHNMFMLYRLEEYPFVFLIPTIPVVS